MNTLQVSTTYSNKPLYNITNKTYTQVFNRKAMGQLWAKRKDFEAGQVELIDCLYKATKKRGTARCESNIEYKLSASGVGKLGYGRYYGQKGSLEQLEKDVRGTLCINDYIDVDVVNCHPTIIPQMAKNWFNQEMPNMMEYVNNRQYFFDEMEEKMGYNEDTTKSLVLRILYGGAVKTTVALPDDCDIDMPKQFIEMKKEMRQFTDKLMKVEDHKELLEYVQRLRKPNVPGSFTSHIIQTEERKLLESMTHWFNENNYRVDVLAYDGVQVRINKDKSVTDDVLEEIVNVVKKDTGYDIKLKIKSFETIAFDDDSDDDENDKSYDQVKEDWEKNHFYFKAANTIVEVTERGITHYGIEHATEAFNTWQFTKKDEDGGKKMIPFLKEWRNDIARRMVDAFVYKMPNECSRNECSLFTGFDYKKITAEVTDEARTDAINTFKDILGAICNDEQAVVDYILKSMAHMLLKPFEKTGVLIAFASAFQGSGKDTIMLILKKIIGDNHTAHYTSTEAYWEKHDTNQEGAIFTYLEEACSNLNKAKSNELKARITSDTIMINPKGVKGYSVPNVSRQWMTTNEAEPFKIEENDRRGLLISPNGRCVSYDWNTIYSKILTPAYIKAVGEYLESISIDGWNPRVFPETHIKKEMKILSKSSETLFFEQWISEDWVSSKEVYEAYKDYCIENSLPHCQSSISFGKKVVSLQNVKFNFKRGTGNVALYNSLTKA